MKSKLEILEETVAYYSEDVSRRAMYTEIIDQEDGEDIEDTQCYYKSPDGKHCAAGRMMTEEFLNSKYLSEGDSILSLLNRSSIPVFKPEYQGHDNFFYAALQRLHDSDANWDKNGLTEQGEEVVESIKRQYINVKETNTNQ
jgi:microsomal dipeptidase-like Zn-dependent dipeptidase